MMRCADRDQLRANHVLAVLLSVLAGAFFLARQSESRQPYASVVCSDVGAVADAAAESPLPDSAGHGAIVVVDLDDLTHPSQSDGTIPRLSRARSVSRGLLSDAPKTSPPRSRG